MFRLHTHESVLRTVWCVVLFGSSISQPICKNVYNIMLLTFIMAAPKKAGRKSCGVALRKSMIFHVQGQTAQKMNEVLSETAPYAV